MAISQHEKELIDYAANVFEQALQRANPFPIDTPDKINRCLSTAIDKSARNMAVELAAKMEKLNAENLLTKKQLANQAADEAKARTIEARRTAIFTAGPVTIVVYLIVEVFKKFLS